ncbi:MAG: hypothetical protein AAF074_13385 [Pseudomonadota bacterium]
MQFHPVPDVYRAGEFTMLDGIVLAAFLPLFLALMIGAQRELTFIAALGGLFTIIFMR